MGIFIASLVSLWLLAAAVVGIQIARLWKLNLVTVGAMTVAQAYRASRRGAVIAFVAMVVLSWPLWLEVNMYDRAVFRDGKLVQVFDSGTVMFQRTWDKTTVRSEAVTLSNGEISAGTAVEMQCPGVVTTNGVLIITIDGRNDRDNTLKRLEYCLRSGMRVDMIGYPPSIVKKVVGESPQFDELCRTAKKLPIEENGDGTYRLKAKRNVLEIAEKISEDLWSRFGIRIVDVDIR